MAAETRVPFWPLAICWALTAGTLIARALLTGASTPLILDTDDAMRLTIVHDLLAGQQWFDHVQHRLNTPYGAEIHWSRLVDLPEAALLLVLRPLLGGLADTALAYLWPLILLLPMMWLTARLALLLGGTSALWPALLLPAFALTTMAEFAPGRLDHHSVQILLALGMLMGAVSVPERPGVAMFTGLAAGLALAIGIEALPMVAATILVAGLLWVADTRHAVSLRYFGLSFALTTLLALALAVAPDRWLTPGVDVISATYALASVLCAAAFIALSLWSPSSWRMRLAAGVFAGTIAAAIAIASFPPLLRGPYGQLDPWLLSNWIDRISEAEPWLVSLAGEPVYALAVAVPVLTAIFVSLQQIRGGTSRWTWLIYLAFLLVALLVMALQIRAARFAVPLAVPGCAVLVGDAWRRMTSTNGLGPIFAVLGSIVASAGFIVALLAAMAVAIVPGATAATTDTYRGARNACLQPSAFTEIANRPAERIMTPIDLGSHMLLYTGHSVVAAPYHRNQQGVLDTFHFFNSSVAEAREIAQRRGLGLVVVCAAMKEIRGLVDHAPDSLVSLFARGRVPGWLRNITPPGSPLQIYSVEP